jgi:hypothetical protein
MKRKLATSILLFLTTIIFSQYIIESGKGFSEVVEVKLEKDGIRQKIKEWITINYKSAKDVIQLDTDEKIITKGNFVFEYLSGTTIVRYRLSTTMIFSLRDNKYKIEISPTKITSKDFPDLFITTGVYELLMTDKVLSENDYLNLSKKITLNQFKLLGYNDKKSQKMLKKTEKYIVENFKSYKLNYKNFKQEVKNTFISIKKTVSEVDDW